ncbi:MAG: hypothetical protein GPOALKHO_001322 [Sodalis sp.]|nr:MAG: hypothetical protein GPOALKHO_001322 [Sodalis sp.]
MKARLLIPSPCTLEEIYEILDAIARSDFGDLCAEPVDLLFRVCFTLAWRASRAIRFHRYL